MRFALLFVALLACGPLVTAAQAQQATTGLSAGNIVVIDSDALFEGSLFGQRVLAEQEARTAVLLAENRQVAADLAQEEQALTEQRETMDAEAFRALAEAFDIKVEDIRAVQNQKEQDIIQYIESERVRFFQELVPVLERILRERRAGLVLEKRFTFASRGDLDVTQQTLQLSDSILKDGLTAETDAESQD